MTQRAEMIDGLSAPTTKTAAMLKANGYGLGSVAIASALVKAGCELFFVANLTEAIELRAVFCQTGDDDITIIVHVQRICSSYHICHI